MRSREQGGTRRGIQLALLARHLIRPFLARVRLESCQRCPLRLYSTQNAESGGGWLLKRVLADDRISITPFGVPGASPPSAPHGEVPDRRWLSTASATDTIREARRLLCDVVCLMDF